MNSTYLLAVSAALAMSISPLAIGNIFADNGHDGGNNADQSIDQDQSSEQNSLCVSGDDTTASCNNFSDQFQLNTGNNALGQQDNDE